MSSELSNINTESGVAGTSLQSLYAVCDAIDPGLDGIRITSNADASYILLTKC